MGSKNGKENQRPGKFSFLAASFHHEDRMTQVWIGTCGYSYPDWVGSFYPPSTRAAQMLAFYSRMFPVIELNFTFYRSPTAEMLVRLAEQTPAGFQFVVKLPRAFSHEKNARGLQDFRAAVEELRRRERLLGLLCQLPPSARASTNNREWLKLLGRELSSTCAVFGSFMLLGRAHPAA